MLETVIMMVAVFAVLYFLMIRPQKKRMDQHMAMQSALQPGDRVLLTSGIFGTIAHVGERQLIVELAPGVEITVLKGNIAKQVVADEEEFEFTDDYAAATDVEDDAVITDDEALSEQFNDLRPEDFQDPKAGDK